MKGTRRFGPPIQSPFGLTEDPAVVTVTFTDEAADPFRFTEPGDTLHVESAGAPAQLSATEPLNPPPGETETVYVALCPGETDALDDDAPTVKSWPIPVSDTVCGLPAPSFVTVKVPLLLPLTVGSKKMPMAQLAPAATLFPQALRTPKSDGLAAIFAMFSVAVP
jgi:hypothetical protein